MQIPKKNSFCGFQLNRSMTQPFQATRAKNLRLSLSIVDGWRCTNFPRNSPRLSQPYACLVKICWQVDGREISKLTLSKKKKERESVYIRFHQHSMQCAVYIFFCQTTLRASSESLCKYPYSLMSSQRSEFSFHMKIYNFPLNFYIYT